MTRPETRRLVHNDHADTRPSRAVHLRPSFLAVVAVGGTLGTAAREALSLVIPTVGGFPVAIFAINMVGAFLLGVLLSSLARSGPDQGRRRLLRLFAGTGFCGGFTTYSSLATITALFVANGEPGRAALYGLGTVMVGAAASWAGIAAARLLRRHRE